MAADVATTLGDRSFGPMNELESRLSDIPHSSLETSSEIVKAIFGSSVGPCWGDFFATHNRIRGRLYASSQAVLFYSNLLGFERRICLRYAEVVVMEMHRTTSIRLEMFDGETYVFRSFNDRVQVLHMLKGLKIVDDRQNGRLIRAPGTANGKTDPFRSEALPTTTPPRRPSAPATRLRPFNSSSGLFPMSATLRPHSSLEPLQLNRKRSASDSLVRIPSESAQPAASPYLQDHSDGDEDESQDEILSATKGSMEDAWNNARTSAMPFVDKVGIELLELPVSLERFFEMFFADNAPYSLDFFQRNTIGDRDIQITGWDFDSDGAFNRTVTFLHPIKNSYGVGPSEARTTRQQRLRRFGDLGMCVENTTVAEGIPSGDAFFVQDHWVIEASSDDSVRLSTRFGTRFTKRALFRGMIEKSILKETQDWLAGYQAMLLEVTQERERIVESKEEKLVDNTELQKLAHRLDRIASRVNRPLAIGFVVMCILLLALLVQVVLLRQSICKMNEEMVELRLEVKGFTQQKFGNHNTATPGFEEIEVTQLR